MTSSSLGQQQVKEWPEIELVRHGGGGEIAILDRDRFTPQSWHEVQRYVPATQQSGDGLERAVEEAITKLQEPARNQEPDAVAIHLQAALSARASGGGGE